MNWPSGTKTAPGLASTAVTQARMKQRTRSFLGTIAMLVSLVAYCALAVAVYERWLVGQEAPLLLLYFALAGAGWCLPAMALIRWMARPDEA